MKIRSASLAAVLVSLTLAGCTAFFSETTSEETVTSSLVDYLYPEGGKPEKPDEASVPRLALPLRVGIAFVPVSEQRGGYWSGSTDLPEATKTELLATVKAEFTDRDYIEHIEIIPQTYLSGQQGFDGLAQIARLYGVDVMALVSYDQVTTSTDNVASLLYWTIVGAYVIPGTSNSTQTFVDTAVFDIESERLLFRAPGTASRERLSTAVGNAGYRNTERKENMRLAIEDMTTNLVAELDRFEARLKTEPTLADVQWRDGSGGGGAAGLLALLAMLSVVVRRRRSAAVT